MPLVTARAARILSIIVLLTIALACPLAALAQLPGLLPVKDTGTDSSQAPTTQPAAPAAVPVGEIASRISDDERFVEEVRLRTAGADPVKRLGPGLAAIERSVDGKMRLFRNEELMQLPVMRLESLERHWKFDARQFALWREEMKLATTAPTNDAQEIARRRADWIATRDAATESRLPAPLRARVDAIIVQLDGAEVALSGPLVKQIELARRANRLEARIAAGQASVVAAIKHIDRRLMRIDAKPMWAMNDGSDDDRALEGLRTGLQVEMDFMRQYGAADAGNQRALHVLQFLLLAALLWLARRARRGDLATATHPSYGRVLRRPFSSWLLLAMMAVPLFEPNAPLLLHQFAMLVALIPVLRMLPPEARGVFGAWPIAATLFYLLQRLEFLLLANAALYRGYLFGLALLAMALTLWLLWRAHRARSAAPPTRALRLLRIGAWIGVGLLALSALSNLFGNVSLAETLLSAIIDSGYIALALYASVNVASALAHAVLHLAAGAGVRVVGDSAEAIARIVARALGIAALVGWAIFTMQQFRVWRPAYALARDVLQHAFTFGEISISLGNVLVFAIAVVVAFLAARAVRYLLRHEVLPKMSLPRGVDNSVASLSYYAMLMLGLLLALSAAGFKVGQLAFVFGALGVGIGLGLQDVVKNFVSGLILMFERPIQPGDVVDVSGTNGTVRMIGMRSTTITTFEGADVVVPNGMLLSEKLTNWTLLDRRRRLEVPVGVAYGSDVPAVMALLRQTVEQTRGVAMSPAPAVLFSGLGASALEFSVRAWTHEYDDWVLIRSDLVSRIHAALVGAGIEIPFPQQDLHLRSVPEGWPMAEAAGEGEDRPDGDGPPGASR
ncbi:mechanosensitive ion channel family protein [Lysobacter brunescens]|uniref:Mechanosensitive ion channel family protein n=1 Tax=Lysobacter brunescens TaxID=262323 RepID=A0ABW2YDB5_9GAMM